MMWKWHHLIRILQWKYKRKSIEGKNIDYDQKGSEKY
jgi:hypothetical protein